MSNNRARGDGLVSNSGAQCVGCMLVLPVAAGWMLVLPVTAGWVPVLHVAGSQMLVLVVDTTAQM